MKKIVLLGGNKLHRGFEALKTKLGVGEIIVVDWNEVPDYTGDIHYRVDIRDTAAVQELPIDWDNVAFVYTSADIAVKTQAVLHRRMGLRTPSDEAIRNALCKGRQRDCWEKTGILNKYSAVIRKSDAFTPGGYLRNTYSNPTVPAVPAISPY